MPVVHGRIALARWTRPDEVEALKRIRHGVRLDERERVSGLRLDIDADDLCIRPRSVQAHRRTASPAKEVEYAHHYAFKPVLRLLAHSEMKLIPIPLPLLLVLLLRLIAAPPLSDRGYGANLLVIFCDPCSFLTAGTTQPETIRYAWPVLQTSLFWFSPSACACGSSPNARHLRLTADY
jgi:hypothetical protein